MAMRWLVRWRQAQGWTAVSQELSVLCRCERKLVFPGQTAKIDRKTIASVKPNPLSFRKRTVIGTKNIPTRTSNKYIFQVLLFKFRLLTSISILNLFLIYKCVVGRIKISPNVSAYRMLASFIICRRLNTGKCEWGRAELEPCSAVNTPRNHLLNNAEARNGVKRVAIPANKLSPS